ncbi:MAG TPA: phosphatase, partial [Chromatiaceae bacterium]|nr:phosphatase [Chromatiaceae bacterium]
MVRCPAMCACYDLHTHSTASDGTLSPGALLRR